MAFVFIGQVNVLAPIVTINFLLTYSFIDYSYFSVAMTFQLQIKEKKDVVTVSRSNQRSSTRQSSRPLIEAALANYGSGGKTPQSKGTLLEFTKDMDHIFPSLSNGDAAPEPPLHELSSGGKCRKASAKQQLMDSFALDLNSNVFPEEQPEETDSCGPQEAAETSCGSRREEARVDGHVEVDPPLGPRSHRAGEQTSDDMMKCRWCFQPHLLFNLSGSKAEQHCFDINPLPDSFYAKFCNHWVALLGVSSILKSCFAFHFSPHIFSYG